MAGEICALIVVLMLCLLWALFWWHQRPSPWRELPAATLTLQRLLKPRTPDDCPACYHHRALHAPAQPPAVRPWRELKHRRGRPKRIATDGFACPNPACAYHRITD